MDSRVDILHRIFTRIRTLGLATATLVGAQTARAEMPALQLVVTWPVEVGEGPDLPAAHSVWRDLIDGARERIDLAHFYASDTPGSRLEPIVRALEHAAARGVSIRWIGEEKFYRTYPETLDRLAAVDGIEVRRLRTGEILGGVLHTKIMLVDGETACLGSQNFDWRSLEHIVELGVRIHDQPTVAVYDAVFEADWALAGGATLDAVDDDWDVDLSGFPRQVDHDGAPVAIQPVLGGPQCLPDASLHDLPALVGAIEGARSTVRAQMLSYSPLTRDGRYWPDLDLALRAAATRGVRVELLVSHWNTRAGEIEHLKSLQVLENVEVRVATVPAWSEGFVPFGRVLHAKSLTVDGRWSWVGTSNWSPGYFDSGRHHGLVVDGAPFASEVEDVFDRVWNADWTTTVDPARDYPAPRIGE